MQQTQQKTIYAFDFDGVICDSALETGITGWKAATSIWLDMGAAPLPSQHQIHQFREVRPLLETGYEALLIMRLLYLGLGVTEVCNDYEQIIHNLVQEENLHANDLKKLFGETRDHWIRTNEQEWLAMNPLFPSAKDKLKSLPDTSTVIITTKQERFVELILHSNGVHINQSKIFGMDRQMSKQEVLAMLKKDSPNQNIVFIEDRVQTLIDILQNPELNAISLQLVSWGYNTGEQRKLAHEMGIKVIDDF